MEMTGIAKQDIKAIASRDILEMASSDKSKRKYHRTSHLPSETDRETARSASLWHTGNTVT
ncbi:MAG: hypothetical protein ACJ71F_21245 [Nitrososphaeraceae archaeon]